ncbi:hypothetical protein P9A10_00255 [Serratia marcescens]|uniref:hypothetical protein n=1 Tax=Serratia TaxID=613 RepID=UPI003204B1B2
MKPIDVFFVIITVLFSSIALSTFGDKPIIAFGNVADIVSAFCNIAMACAAVYAGSKAVNFFQQKAYDHALEIIKEINKIRISINHFNVELLIKTSIKAGVYTPPNFPSDYENPNTPNDFDTQLHEMQEFDSKLSVISADIMNIIVSLRSTKPFGYVMNDDYLEPLCKALSQYSNDAIAHIIFYKNKHEYIYSALKPDMPFTNNDKHVSLNESYETIKNISSQICTSSPDEIFNFNVKRK